VKLFQSTLANEIFCRMIISNKACNDKIMFENKIQILLFIKLFSVSKRNYLETLILFYLMQVSLLPNPKVFIEGLI
jgi:hypothetical protein